MAASCQVVNGSASGCVHPGMNPDPMPQPRRRRPVALIAAVAAVTAVVVTAAIVGLAYLGSGSEPASASSTTAPPSALAVDKATARACELADASTGGRGDPAEVLAAASVSDEGALRDIAAAVLERTHATDVLEDVRGQTAVYKISTWCLNHGLG